MPERSRAADVKSPTPPPPPAQPERQRDPGAPACWPGPFERLAYFHGQMLTSDDLRTEQRYFIEKQKLHNRCMHGWGVVCGLELGVRPCPGESAEKLDALIGRREALEVKLAKAIDAGDADGQGQVIRELQGAIDQLTREIESLDDPSCADAVGPHFTVSAGLALDCEGNEILLHDSREFSLDALLDPRDGRAFRTGRHAVWISIRFVDQPTHPVRPSLPDGCGVPRSREFGRWRDHWKVVASLTPPREDTRCETCCDGCCCDDVLLARIDAVAHQRLLKPAQIHNEARRMLAKYVPTRITGISWTHGAEYSRDEIEAMIEDGFAIHFSRPVRAETIRRGVVDLWVVDGGRGRNGNIWRMEVKFVGLPATGWVDEVRFHNDSGEVLNPGDRVIIQFRGEFVLDACCQPIAGVHVGGKVPLLADYERWRRPDPNPATCVIPPEHPGPWTSGSALVGGSHFESWVYLADPHNSENPR